MTFFSWSSINLFQATLYSVFVPGRMEPSVFTSLQNEFIDAFLPLGRVKVPLPRKVACGVADVFQ